MNLACLAALSLLSVSAAAKPAVAVLYFDYEGKNEEMGLLRKGLAQMFITDLSAHQDVTVVERARLQEILDELKLGQTNKVDPATAGKIGKLLGARFLVMGGYFDMMGTLRVDARVVETETGRIVKSTGASAKPDEFLDLQQKVSRELASILGTAASKAATGERPAPAKQKGSKLPTKLALRYSKALDAMDRKDTASARKELEAVVKEQPDFMLAAADLASLVK